VALLTTDIESAVDVFQCAFGSRLVLQPGARRAGPLKEETFRLGNDRSEILAREELIDCLLLARCGLLLHVTSNVANDVGCHNPTLRMVYCETLAQAAWVYVWSTFSSSPRMDWVSRWRFWPPFVGAGMYGAGLRDIL
jgi:hypothetical protein